jgi:hypothetical protein
MKYFDAAVKVRVESVDSKGNPKFKKVRKNYLVDSLTVTEAEARVVKAFEEMGGVQEFSVMGVTGSKFIDAILVDGDTQADEKFYEVCVEIKVESQVEEDLRVKKIRENFLVEAKNLSEVEQKIKKIYEGGFSNDYEIVSIKKSKVVEIITPETTVLKDLPEGKWSLSSELSGITNKSSSLGVQNTEEHGTFEIDL